MQASKCLQYKIILIFTFFFRSKRLRRNTFLRHFSFKVQAAFGKLKFKYFTNLSQDQISNSKRSSLFMNKLKKELNTLNYRKFVKYTYVYVWGVTFSYPICQIQCIYLTPQDKIHLMKRSLVSVFPRDQSALD